MTADQSKNITQRTNGHQKIERQIAETRAVLRGPEKRGRFGAKLVLPALLALGVVFVLRHFEQSTSD